MKQQPGSGTKKCFGKKVVEIEIFPTFSPTGRPCFRFQIRVGRRTLTPHICVVRLSKTRKRYIYIASYIYIHSRFIK